MIYDRLRKDMYTVTNFPTICCKMICVPIKWVKNSKCTKCGADYLSCKCVKFIDEDVLEHHIEYEQIGMTWTNRVCA